MFDVCVLGGGSAGLVIALGAASAGKKVALFESGLFGGDCTNYGCIPSKALIASAKDAKANPTFDRSHALDTMRNIVSSVRKEEDTEALRKRGITVYERHAHFASPKELTCGTRAKHFVIATGSSPRIPPITGIEHVAYHTNETIFSLKSIPKKLLIVGAGPIGCELAQAFSRLGSEVFLFERGASILSKENQKARELIEKVFQSEGIHLVHNSDITSAAQQNDVISLHTNQGVFDGDSLLISAGRKPNVDTLNLDAAAITWSDKGIPTDRFGRTNQSHIWAVGDVIGPPYFTHYAEHQARTVLRNILIPIFRKKTRPKTLPRVTFTDPEIATVGEFPNAAQTYTIPFSHIDRAKTDGCSNGFVTIATTR